MILLLIALILTISSSKQLFNFYMNISLEENLLMFSNIFCGVCLIVVAIYKLYIERSLSVESQQSDEDLYLNKLERKSYNASYYVLIASVVSFLTFTIGFILLRESNPKVVLMAVVLSIISFCCFFVPGQKMMELTLPNYKITDVNSKDPIADTLDYYDDGLKHLMLKSFYKLYFSLILAFVLLIFALMFYSIFSGNSQIVSIIGIGIILLFLLITFTVSLKPKKLELSNPIKQSN